MKLKKIASLVLAGVMAVSMLAACGDNGNSGSSSSEPVVPGETTIASKVNAGLKGDVSGLISFTDDSVMQNLMNEYFENNELTTALAANAYVTAQHQGSVSTNVAGDLKTRMQLDNVGFTNTGVNTDDDVDADDKSDIEVYALKSDLTEDVVAQRVAERINTLTLNKEDSGATVNYKYTGSIAVTKAETKGGSTSIWVVAVVINKDVVAK